MSTIRKCVLQGIVSIASVLSSHWVVAAGCVAMVSCEIYAADKPLNAGVDSEAMQIAKLYGLLNAPAGTRPKNFDERLKTFVDERNRIARYLRRQGIVATNEAIDRRLESVERVLARDGKTLDEALASAQIEESELREVLSVPVAWNEYLRLVLTEAAIKREFVENREHYDGTTIELAQVFLVKRSTVLATNGSGPPNDGNESKREADEIHTSIMSGETSFEDAVLKHSESPSSNNDGRIGAVRYRGDVPSQVAAWAFAAEIGDMSPPIATMFGQHIVKVLSRKKGDRSLEDARAEVVSELSDRLWETALKSGRP